VLGGFGVVGVGLLGVVFVVVGGEVGELSLMVIVCVLLHPLDCPLKVR